MTKLQRLKTRTHKFFRAFIQTAGFLATLLTILAALGITSTALGFFSHELISVITGILVCLAAGLLYILFYTLLEERLNLPAPQSTAQDTKKYPPPQHNEHVEILLREIVYEYSSDGKTMWQRKRQQVRALRSGVISYTDRYNWSGSGICNVQSLTEGFQVMNQRKEEIEENWDYFDVKFPHHLHIDEIVDFTIEWELIDEERKAVPYLSTMIEREMNRLLLQVVLPRELAPTRAYFYVFANYVETLPIETQPIQWSPASRILQYEVPQPTIYHKYTIRWYRD